VDDEPDVVKSVQDLLRLDYRVLTATRAVDGLKILQEQEVHVVMTDQRMPGMTGVEFLHNIRGEHPEAIRLLFTGYADIKAVIDAINAGNVYRYITKPWDPDELQAVIREACERYDLIAERKKLMADLQAKNVELEKANSDLLAANKLKSAFIQVASHELRTPLTILLGLTDLAGRTPSLSEPLRGWVSRIKAASERMMRLVEQIVTMLAAGKFEQMIQKKPTDLGELLGWAVDDVQPFLELRRQNLVRDWPAELGKIPLEPEYIRDGVNHLLLNAIKFTPDGGTITVHAARTQGDGAEIVIADTGIGIEPANLPHLFEPFFTGFNVERHSSGQFEYGRQGIGLGLSVVKEFVEMHGGTLSVQSELEKGTRFTIRLPG
jgi:signal transduction histidine kinase